MVFILKITLSCGVEVPPPGPDARPFASVGIPQRMPSSDSGFTDEWLWRRRLLFREWPGRRELFASCCVEEDQRWRNPSPPSSSASYARSDWFITQRRLVVGQDESDAGGRGWGVGGGGTGVAARCILNGGRGWKEERIGIIFKK